MTFDCQNNLMEGDSFERYFIEVCKVLCPLINIQLKTQNEKSFNDKFWDDICKLSIEHVAALYNCLRSSMYVPCGSHC